MCGCFGNTHSKFALLIQFQFNAFENLTDEKLPRPRSGKVLNCSLFTETSLASIDLVGKGNCSEFGSRSLSIGAFSLSCNM